MGISLAQIGRYGVDDNERDIGIPLKQLAELVHVHDYIKAPPPAIGSANGVKRVNSAGVGFSGFKAWADSIGDIVFGIQEQDGTYFAS